MPHDVRLQSLEFKKADGYCPIASVKVNLTHDNSSKVFEKEGISFGNKKVINFDLNRPIKRVRGADNHVMFNFITGVKFMDKLGSQVSIYDPYNHFNDHLG